MRVLDWVTARATDWGHEIADSGRTVLYLRNLLRGNHVRPASETARTFAAMPSRYDQPPVLLIPGYLSTRGSVALLERRLAMSGHLVLSYPPELVNMGDIRRAAGRIAHKVESLFKQTSIEKLDMVGHSMGGLVGLHYIKRLGGHRRVRRLLLLGTPTRGTWSALAGVAMAPFGRAGLQLLPRSSFLRDLCVGDWPPGVEIISLAGDRDHLAPLQSTMLSGVRHVSLPTCHSGLLVDPKVADVVASLLEETPDQQTRRAESSLRR